MGGGATWVGNLVLSFWHSIYFTPFLRRECLLHGTCIYIVFFYSPCNRIFLFGSLILCVNCIAYLHFYFLYLWRFKRDTPERGDMWKGNERQYLCKKQTLNINVSANLTSRSSRKENVAHSEFDLSSGEHWL